MSAPNLNDLGLFVSSEERLANPRGFMCFFSHAECAATTGKATPLAAAMAAQGLAEGPWVAVVKGDAAQLLVVHPITAQVVKAYTSQEAATAEAKLRTARYGCPGEALTLVQFLQRTRERAAHAATVLVMAERALRGLRIPTLHRSQEADAEHGANP